MKSARENYVDFKFFPLSLFLSFHILQVNKWFEFCILVRIHFHKYNKYYSTYNIGLREDIMLVTWLAGSSF